MSVTAVIANFATSSTRHRTTPSPTTVFNSRTLTSIRSGGPTRLGRSANANRRSAALLGLCREANDWNDLMERSTHNSEPRFAGLAATTTGSAGGFEFPPGIEKFFRPTAAFELAKGCSVGCWFCAVSAPRFEEVFAYTHDNAQDLADGPGAVPATDRSGRRRAMCCRRRDPLDNPDYERFVDDFFGVHGLYPTTLTALPIKNPRRTRLLLRSTARPMVACRISFPFCRSVFLITCMPSFLPRTCCAFPWRFKTPVRMFLRPPFPSRFLRER